MKVARAGHPATVEENPAVRLVGDHPDRTAVAPARLSQLLSQPRQRGRRVNPPRGIVRGVDDYSPGPWPQRPGDALDVQVEVRRMELDPNRSGTTGDDHRFVEEPRRAQENDLVARVDQRAE